MKLFLSHLISVIVILLSIVDVFSDCSGCAGAPSAVCMRYIAPGVEKFCDPQQSQNCYCDWQ